MVRGLPYFIKDSENQDGDRTDGGWMIGLALEYVLCTLFYRAPDLAKLDMLFICCLWSAAATAEENL